MLNRKDAQMVADNHYSRKNVKNGIMATLLNSSTPVTTTGLNTMFNINSAGARVSEIVKEFHYRGRLIRQGEQIISELKKEVK